MLVFVVVFSGKHKKSRFDIASLTHEISTSTTNTTGNGTPSYLHPTLINQAFLVDNQSAHLRMNKLAHGSIWWDEIRDHILLVVGRILTTGVHLGSHRSKHLQLYVN